MADALTGKTEVSPTIETIVLSEIQMVLNDNVVMPPLVTDISSMVGKGMDTVKIPRIGKFTVETKLENVALSAQLNAFAADSLLLDQPKAIQFLVEDVAEIESKVFVAQAYIQQAAMDLAVELDQYILDTLEAGVSTAAPDNKRAYANSPTNTIQKVDILLARQLLNDQNVPLDGRSAIVAPDQEAALLAISEFVRVDESGGSEALRNGRIGKLFGFDFYVKSGAESLKSMFWHKSACAFARQLQPKYEMFRDVPNLGDRHSIFHKYGAKSLDSGKRQVLIGTA